MKQEKFFAAPVEFSFEGWREDLRDLFSRDQATQWDIGDLLLAAEDYYLGVQEDWTSPEAKKFRREAERITKKKWRTLKNYKSISRKFPKNPEDGSPSLRSDTLSYSAYVLIGPFSRENQVKLLEKAEKQKVTTVDDMRELVRREQKWGGLPKNQKPSSKTVVLKITVSLEEKSQLLDIARAKNFGQGAAQALWWLACEYVKEHKEPLKAEVKAYKAARESDRKEIAEGNGAGRKATPELQAAIEEFEERDDVPTY